MTKNQSSFAKTGFLFLSLLLMAACSKAPVQSASTNAPPAGLLSFSAASYSVSQTATSVTVVVSRTSGSTGAISVSYNTADNTATAGGEYNQAIGTLTWPDGDTTNRQFTVQILNTTPFAGTKSFSVSLSDALGGSALGTNATASVNISGSAVVGLQGTLSLVSSPYTIAQNAGTITLSVNRSGGSTGAVSVNYATTNGTAIAGTDYTTSSGTLNWADGVSTAQTISVPISNAAPFVGTKVFSITLSQPGGGAVLGAATTSTVTINGSGTTGTAGALALSAATYSIAQSVGTVTITVNRGNGSTGTASVSYATSDNTAKAGTDYNARAGTLMWNDGDSTAKTVVLTISNATPFSGTRTFSFALSSAVGATLGTPSSALISIVGSPQSGSLSFAAATYNVGQAQATVILTVNRTNGSSGNVAISYTTSNGTATAGTDFTMSSGQLTWKDGDTAAKNISIPVSNANPYTGTKNFAVTLFTPTGNATLASPIAASVNITGSQAVVSSNPMGQAAAARLLMQSTFGGSLDTINTVANQSYDDWFAAQAAITPSYTLPPVQAAQPTNINWIIQWFNNVNTGQDQLRQRMAFALSQILVVSDNQAALAANNLALASYYDVLVKDALGNYRTLLQDVTLSPVMGVYLSLLKSDKANPATNVHADQNYAREVMQLFTVGLVRLNLDGSVVTDTNGIGVPTYNQTTVENTANALTGWASAPTAGQSGDAAWQYSLDYLDPMAAYEDHHDMSAKTIFDSSPVPAGGTAEADLKIVLDTLFNDPNVGPFICQQLIQRLVTSNPSPAYVQRVSQIFNDNGNGVRGDLLAVAKAIVTDPEAISPGGSTYGKLREPILRLTELWRAFNAISQNGGNGLDDNVYYYGASSFAQFPLDAPSVFNFYRPDFRLPGALTSAGLVVPEFQITNENTLVLTNNLLRDVAYQYVDSSGTVHAGADSSGISNGDAVLLHTSSWEQYAANPASLVDQLNLVLMAGTMPTAMRTTLIAYATAIPASSAGSRVAETAELIINSPQFAIQR